MNVVCRVCCENDRQSACRFEKQVPACRVPRGRLDWKPTRWQQDHGGEGVSPSSIPSLPLSMFLRPPCALRVPSLLPLFVTGALPLLFSLPFSRGLCVKRWSTGALTLSTDRQSIRRQARTFAREIVIFTVPSFFQFPFTDSLLRRWDSSSFSHRPPPPTIFYTRFPRSTCLSWLYRLESYLIFLFFSLFYYLFSFPQYPLERKSAGISWLRIDGDEDRNICTASFESFVGSSTIVRLGCR